MPETLLEIRLGNRFGHPEVFRQRALGPYGQSGGGPRQRAVGRAVCQALAGSAGADGRRNLAATGPRDTSGFGGFTRAGESVPALRRRLVDGPGGSGGPPSAPCPRRGGATTQPPPRAGRRGRDRRA